MPVVKIEPDVIVWAREFRGLTLEEAAKKAKLKPELLAEYEQGIRDPTPGNLRKLAAAYRLPEATLVRRTAWIQPEVQRRVSR